MFEQNQPPSSIALINVLNATVSSSKPQLRLARTTFSATRCFPGYNPIYNTTSIVEADANAKESKKCYHR